MSDQLSFIDDPFPGTPTRDTLMEARAFVRTNLAEGTACPCCGQLVKLYRRPLGAMMARQLIALYRHFKRFPGEEWVHAPKLLTKLQLDRECAKLCHWRLIEEKAVGDRGDGSTHAGYYRMTRLGEQFVEGLATVPRYVYLLDGKVQRYSDDESTDIRRALGTKFDYHALMTGAPWAP